MPDVYSKILFVSSSIFFSLLSCECDLFMLHLGGICRRMDYICGFEIDYEATLGNNYFVQIFLYFIVGYYTN